MPGREDSVGTAVSRTKKGRAATVRKEQINPASAWRTHKCSLGKKKEHAGRKGQEDLESVAGEGTKEAPA